MSKPKQTATEALALFEDEMGEYAAIQAAADSLDMDYGDFCILLAEEQEAEGK